jgi:hypothetical protein
LFHEPSVRPPRACSGASLSSTGILPVLSRHRLEACATPKFFKNFR